MSIGKSSFYHLGYLTDNVMSKKKHKLPYPICYDMKIDNYNFSMCRYPTTRLQARPYLPHTPKCKCDRYLNMI